MQIIIILLLSSIKVALFEHILTNSLSNGLICSGKRYDAKKYPYVVSISIRPADKAFGYVCTGSLINELYILTAGHCTFGRTINEIKVSIPMKYFHRNKCYVYVYYIFISVRYIVLSQKTT